MAKSPKEPKNTKKATKESTKPQKQPKEKSKKTKIVIIVLVIIILLLGAGAGIMFWLANQKGEDSEVNRVEFAEPIYSILTGEEISDASLNSSPTFCVQIPNGSTDGARPQSGLDQAAIVFEAIAETGITRLAAVFQNPTTSAIGPIRSLRPYYLDWDTPFDCTVVHAGGSNEALNAIAAGGQRNLDENYAYMWREDNTGRLWNNLFSSTSLLSQFNTDNGYTTSQPKAFPRYTPEENDEILATQICDPEDTSECAFEPVTEVFVTFGNSPSHNVRYAYDQASNSYLRFHQDGDPHLTYSCSADLVQPTTKTDCGDPVQIAPKAIAIMRVQESTMADNYHEDIQTIGSGEAIIFQNGDIIHGTWKKTSQNSQIVFTDENGEEVRFTPGQLWVEAVPQFGGVEWR